MLLFLVLGFLLSTAPVLADQSTDEPILFYDDFSEDNLNNWTVESGNWTVQNGYLEGTGNGQALAGRVGQPPEIWDDYRLELDVDNVAGIDEGITFRNQDSQSYELNLRHGSGAYNTPEVILRKNLSGVVTILGDTHSFPLYNNVWYHVKIEAVQSTITLWINGTKVLNVTDQQSPIKQGTIGLAYWTGDFGLDDVYFDNIKVTSLDTPPQPFLILPWDYKSSGKTFDQVVFNPNSWFDHNGPLQNVPCCVNDIVNYTGEHKALAYKSHSGYDYGSKVGVLLNTPVLAAASGWATFKAASESAGAGNMIKIDHGNGYQTWYEHLSSEDLVLSDEKGKVYVTQGQPIGKVGMTGNTNGPHIHLSVFKDANENGSFNDDYPYGLTDPLGWEGNSIDPWVAWTSNNRHGVPSYNLYIDRSPVSSAVIPTSGGSLNADQAIIQVPPNTSSDTLTISSENAPFENISDTIKSIVPSLILRAANPLGQAVTQFTNSITVIYDYENGDLSKVDEDTLLFYYFNEATGEWEPIPTTIDKINKTATFQTDHFSHFALMGQVKDITPPTTEAIVTGNQGQDNWYRSDVRVSLNGQDNDGGSGLQYTLYTLDGDNWQIYSAPLSFTQAGDYTIIFQSFDKAGNSDESQTTSFHIDKTPPEAQISIIPTKQTIAILGLDANLASVEQTDNPDTKNSRDSLFKITDLAGNLLTLDVRDFDKTTADSFTLYWLAYNQDSPIVIPQNRYHVVYENQQDSTIPKQQSYAEQGNIKIRIEYNSQANQSTITTQEPGQTKNIEVKPGLDLLQLQTNQGNVEYSYQ